MTRAEWKALQRNDAPPHPLTQQPLDALCRTLSQEMLRLIHCLAQDDQGRKYVGWSLWSWGFTLKTVLACARRGLVEVSWARVPKEAPIEKKVSSIQLASRGRAVHVVMFAPIALTQLDDLPR